MAAHQTDTPMNCPDSHIIGRRVTSGTIRQIQRRSTPASLQRLHSSAKEHKPRGDATAPLIDLGRPGSESAPP